MPILLFAHGNGYFGLGILAHMLYLFLIWLISSSTWKIAYVIDIAKDISSKSALHQISKKGRGEFWFFLGGPSNFRLGRILEKNFFF